MDAFEILKDKAVKKLEARKLIADAISDGSFSLDDFCSKAGGLNDKQIATAQTPPEPPPCRTRKVLA